MKWFFRFLLKILFAPIMIVLTVLAAFLTFLFGVGSVILTILSGISCLLSLGMFILPPHEIAGGIAFMVISFLLSPFGLPKIIEWLLLRLYDLKYFIKDVVYDY